MTDIDPTAGGHRNRRLALGGAAVAAVAFVGGALLFAGDDPAPVEVVRETVDQAETTTTVEDATTTTVEVVETTTSLPPEPVEAPVPDDPAPVASPTPTEAPTPPQEPGTWDGVSPLPVWDGTTPPTTLMGPWGPVYPDGYVDPDAIGRESLPPLPPPPATPGADIRPG